MMVSRYDDTRLLLTLQLIIPGWTTHRRTLGQPGFCG